MTDELHLPSPSLFLNEVLNQIQNSVSKQHGFSRIVHKIEEGKHCHLISDACEVSLDGQETLEASGCGSEEAGSVRGSRLELTCLAFDFRSSGRNRWVPHMPSVPRRPQMMPEGVLSECFLVSSPCF